MFLGPIPIGARLVLWRRPIHHLFMTNASHQLRVSTRCAFSNSPVQVCKAFSLDLVAR